MPFLWRNNNSTGTQGLVEPSNWKSTYDDCAYTMKNKVYVLNLRTSIKM